MIEVFNAYVAKRSPITQAVEDRIQIIYGEAERGDGDADDGSETEDGEKSECSNSQAQISTPSAVVQLALLLWIHVSAGAI